MCLKRCVEQCDAELSDAARTEYATQLIQGCLLSQNAWPRSFSWPAAVLKVLYSGQDISASPLIHSTAEKGVDRFDGKMENN